MKSLILIAVFLFQSSWLMGIMDNDGNKIELWEPKDEFYETIVEGKTK